MNDMPPHRENPIITKLDSPEFHSIFTPELQIVIDLFKKHNHEIRVAGGAVRDILMHIQPADLDFATTATPTEMKEMFTKEGIRMINNKGEKHGTITSRINDKENFEVTTLRVDRITDGRHAEVEFTKDWKLDSNRRDLTINSMFLDFEGNVYDYFYGYEDLEKKRVAFVGEAATRIQEDFLRILRYFRFYGRIADAPNNHEQKTLDTIKENASGLKIISGERIWVELQKILQGNFSTEIITTMLKECELSKYIGLPENPNLENFYQIGDNNTIPLKPASRIASLLRNAEDILQLHERLKFSAYDRELITFIVKYRQKVPNDNLKYCQSIVLHASTFNVTKSYMEELLRYKGYTKLLKKFQSWESVKFPMNGNMIKPFVKKNSMIGEVLTKLKDIWLDHDFKLSSEELNVYIPDIVAEVEEQRLEKKRFKNK